MPIFVSSGIEQAGHQLLDHQCWVLGKDVLNSTGNMLCEFGFRQVRCPNGGMTQYELKDGLGKDTHVYLWGFGAFFGDASEGIFLGRKDFRPRRTLGRVELHSKEVPDFDDETSRLDLFLRGLLWFADYEQWVNQRRPDGYREQCLTTFPRRTLPGSEFAPRWRALANCIQEEQPTWDRTASKSASALDRALPRESH